MARRLKRTELLNNIVEKAGLPREGNAMGYLSRRQLQVLLLWIEKNEHDWKNASKELEILNERSRAEYGGNQSKASQPEDI